MQPEEYLVPSYRHKWKKMPAYFEGVQLTAPDGKVLAENILKNTLVLSESFPLPASWLSKTSEAFTKELNREFVNEILIAVLIEAGKRSGLGDKIPEPVLDDLKKGLQASRTLLPTGRGPYPSAGSHDSKAWKILRPFLTSPAEQVFDYRKVQSERSEMEHAIRRATIDLKMETIRKGSPHILRITKTQVAYEKKYEEWIKDVELLKRVEKKFA